MISVRNLSFNHGAHPIFDGVNFTIQDNAKVGLVGPNGAGKSTLFQILTKQLQPDDGKIEMPEDVIFVPQEVKHDPDMVKAESIRDYLDPYYSCQDYELENTLKGLELANLTLRDVPQNLSGGQKTKLAIARALMQYPQVLMLDEPTNFLDRNGKYWLMRWLSVFPNTLIIISHDLDLLDKDIDKILAVNGVTKNVDEYKGNYAKYLVLKGDQEKLVVKQADLQQKQISRLEESIKVVGVRQRINLQNRVIAMKANLPTLPPTVKSIKVNFPPPAPIGEIVLKVAGVKKSYGEKTVLDNINFSIQRGERLALIGHNGAGKSTLIKIVMGRLDADSGEIFRDERTKVGYYSQEFETFDLNQTLFAAARASCTLQDGEIRAVLGKFLFPGGKAFQTIATLSGGEKTRLSIALLMLQNYNFLVLDEPTTYLDVLSQRIILEALKQYQGAMLVVSHTDEFIAELEPNRALILPENRFDLWRDEFLGDVAEL